MQTQDVLSRLKQATSDRIPATDTPTSDPVADAVALDGACHNCGTDGTAVERRPIVPSESPGDGNEIALCPDCTDRTPVLDAPAATPESTGTPDVSASAFRTCATMNYPVNGDVVRARDDHTCRGCGVREALVVGDDLHLHPVVPIEHGGYRHPHNFVSLCTLCHRTVHE